jgi:hypothetical protein
MPTFQQQLAMRWRTSVPLNLAEIRQVRSAIRAGSGRRPSRELQRADAALARAEERRARAVARSRR